MRVTLFEYMVVISVSLISRILLGSLSRSERSGPGSQVPRSAFLAGPGRNLSGSLCRSFQTCSGRNRDPQGALEAKQNDAEPQGAGLAPKQ